MTPKDRTNGPFVGDLSGSKAGAIYRAHSYHTKVPIETIGPLIAHYTDPGQRVVDPFCGSGMTGVAAVLAGRHATISDLSPAAVHIARGYTLRLSPTEFTNTAAEWLARHSELESNLYGSPEGRVEYRVWSDQFECPKCGDCFSFWDRGVTEDGKVAKVIHCGQGHGPFRKQDLTWLAWKPVQENLSVHGSRQRLVREPKLGDDLARTDIEGWIPELGWDSWREMWRQQHKTMGTETAADFYTNRNLVALSALWASIDSVAEDVELQLALRFAFTAIVNRASRRYQWHPTRPTNVLSSTMYIASLHYEFNVFSLLRRKISALAKLYAETADATGSCEVVQGSATDLSWLDDSSADFIFTDPPFGSNIYYGDSSFLWEAWLGSQTDVAAEAVVNRRLPEEQGHTSLTQYGDLLTQSFEQMRRVLKPNAWLSLQFHNSSDRVWSELQKSIEAVDLQVAGAAVMDKGQSSFKGLRYEAKGEKVADFDLVMHLTEAEAPIQPAQDAERSVRETLVRLVSERNVSAQRAHSMALRELLADGHSLTGWSFARIEQLLEEIRRARVNACQDR